MTDFVEGDLGHAGANTLAEGTRVRATLGESVIVGTVEYPTAYPMVRVLPDIAEGGSYGFVAFSLYFEAGWQFEILDGATDV